MYLDFCYLQFVRLWGATALRCNGAAVNVGAKSIFGATPKYIQYHEILARSIASFAPYFGCQIYHVPKIDLKSHDIIESVGTIDYSRIDSSQDEQSFIVCEKCFKADPPLVILNQHTMHFDEGKDNTSLQQVELDTQYAIHQSESSLSLFSPNLAALETGDSHDWQLHFRLTSPLSVADNFEDDIMLHPSARDRRQRKRLELILRACGGYHRYDECTQKIHKEFEHNTEKREALVRALMEKHNDYTLTFDNVIKIVGIFMRIDAKVPTLIMGETGCGKTYLLKFMASVLGIKMICVDVHHGYLMKSLKQDIENTIKECILTPNRKILLFFDQINTCCEMASFKEIICDKTFMGNALPGNLIVIGALNPYRKKKYTEEAYHIKKMDENNNVKMQRKDTLSRKMWNLVYQVYPLPKAMHPYVWNFGYLSRETEGLYISAMINHGCDELIRKECNMIDVNKYTQKLHNHINNNGKMNESENKQSDETSARFKTFFKQFTPTHHEVPSKKNKKGQQNTHNLSREGLWQVRMLSNFEEFKNVFVNLVKWSQITLRQWHNDVSVVSLRDVNRVNKFFIWFYVQLGKSYELSTELGDDDAEWHSKRVLRAIILALAQCYYYRLEKPSRKRYDRYMSEQLDELDIQESFDFIVRWEQEQYVNKFRLAPGICLNRVFRENIFVMAVGHATNTPTHVVGRPASSKTLAFNAMVDNLKEWDPKLMDKLDLPTIEVKQLKCCKTTTADMIEQTFEEANDKHWAWKRKTKRQESPQTFIPPKRCVVYLDNILPTLPLHVLGKLLENYEIGFIGCGNWRLDSAKTNRCILHEVIPLTSGDGDQDLIETINTMNQQGPGGRALPSYWDTYYAREIVHFYRIIVKSQEPDDVIFHKVGGKVGVVAREYGPFDFSFYGDRDFYHLVGYIKYRYNYENCKLNDELIFESIVRNFGGLTSQQQSRLTKTIDKTMRFNVHEIGGETDDMFKKYNALRLIRDNVQQSQLIKKDGINYDMRHILLICESDII